MGNFLSSLVELSLSNVLNSAYTVLLLLLLALLLRRWLGLRTAQTQWREKWREMSSQCHNELTGLAVHENSSSLYKGLSETWAADLVPYAHIRGPLPEVESQVQGMLEQTAHEQKLSPYELERSVERWDKVAGFAILLGLLGTFVGLTLALLKLPVKGGLKTLTGGLQMVLPLMGTAFWTSVCGLLSSLFIRLSNRQADSFHHQRLRQVEQSVNTLSRVTLHELYPRLAPAGAVAGGSIDMTPLLEAAREQQTQQQQVVESMLNGLLQGSTAIQETLSALPATQRQFQQQIELLQHELDRLKASLASLSDELQTGLQPWQVAVGELSSELSGIQTQTAHLQSVLETTAQREEQWPEKVEGVLNASLQPAQKGLKKTTRTLMTLIQQQSERGVQEQQQWRRMLQEFQTALLQRSHDGESTDIRGELQEMTDVLRELSTRLQFHAALSADEDEKEETELSGGFELFGADSLFEDEGETA